jgi:hypothetical protein
LSGPLVAGKRGESRAIEVLAHALREEGRDVQRLPTTQEDDARGKDGLLRIDGRDTVVQVVTVPGNPVFWRQFRTTGEASPSVDLRAAVELVRTSLQIKEHAKGVIVVVDAAHFGALAWRPLVDAYLAQHGDPVAGFGFADAWIIGPTIRSSIRLRA